MESSPRRLFVAGLIGALAFAVTGCGSGSGGSSGSGAKDSADELSATPSAQVTTTASADAEVIAITITADSVTPAGDRIQVKRNQPVVLEIDAAAAGELHVHSTPEKHIAFPAGNSQVQLTLDQPGVVDVEDHTLDKLIVQLEVR